MQDTITPKSLATLLFSLWRHLGRRRKVQLVCLAGLMLASALAEVLSLGAVLPFLAVLMNPESVLGHPLIRDAAIAMGISSASQLVLPLTLLFIAATLLASGVRLLLLWANTRMGFAAGADLGIAVYQHTLHLPYSTHLSRNSSEVISGIVNKINASVFGVLLPLLNLSSSTVLLLAILGTLLAINAMIAGLAAVSFGLTYGLISLHTRKRLAASGRRIADEQTNIIKALQEGLGGIRDVLLDGTQQYYCDVYRRADAEFRRAQASSTFISQSPRYLLEGVGIVVIAVLAYAMSLHPGGLATAMPLLGALALGAQRLLPTLQQVYHSWASIIGNQASLADTLQVLDQQRIVIPASGGEPLSFKDSIALDNVCFRYSDESNWVLDKLSMEIPKGTRIGIVGATGSGKSTLVDLLLGLLPPTNGDIRVDREPLAGPRLPAWQRIIAHVPQDIYLADASFAENIAFGLPLNEIDLDRVKAAAAMAQIDEFIASRPRGFDEAVGERGVKLSGGQRQRIGIARALYKQARVLVFDEATSALDNATEQSVMQTIASLDRAFTVVVVAHRLTTLSNCDQIIEIKNGKLAWAGTYAQLIDRADFHLKGTVEA